MVLFCSKSLFSCLSFLGGICVLPKPKSAVHAVRLSYIQFQSFSIFANCHKFFLDTFLSLLCVEWTRRNLANFACGTQRSPRRCCFFLCFQLVVFVWLVWLFFCLEYPAHRHTSGIRHRPCQHQLVTDGFSKVVHIEMRFRRY